MSEDLTKCFLTSAQTAEAGGARLATFQTWAQRRYIPNLDADLAIGRGRARLYSTADVYAVAIYAHAHQWGGKLLASFAHTAAIDALEHREISEIVIRAYGPGEGVDISYNDEMRENPPRDGALVTVRIDLRAIMDATANRLAVVVDKALKGDVTVTGLPKR